MVEELFRQDAYLRAADAIVTAVDDKGVRLDRTVFYPTGGGQPGDSGVLRWDAAEARVIDSVKVDGGDVLHVLAPELGIDLGFELRTNGVPRSGDTVSIDPTRYTATNNGNAKAFLNIQTEAFVGRQRLEDGSITAGSTINDAYASAMSEVGARVQSATYLSGVSTTAAADAEASRAGQAGVNLDEEAARLLQFQQAYQASAKFLQIAQSTFDSLLQTVGR